MGSKLILHSLTMIAFVSGVWASRDPRRDLNGSSGTKIIDTHVFTTVVAYLSNAVLPCYVPELDDASTYPYRWYKEGNEVKLESTEAVPDVQKGDRDLHIQNATSEDSGNYSCHVYTNLGTKEVNVSLIVLESLDAEKSPYFGNVSSFPHVTNRKKIGSSVEFRCPADGSPPPRLEWYKNDVSIGSYNFSNEVLEIHRWSIILKNLTLSDAGNYSCFAINRLGSANMTFTLDITNGSQPDLAVFHPLNTTVKFGSSATFQCRVRSEAVPKIQWLKRMEGGTSVRKEEHDVLKVQGETYRILRSSQVVKRPDGSYLNKLVIPEAHESDTGKYICLGANKMGYSFRSAFLTVLPRPRAVTGWSHHVSVHPGDPGSFQVAFPTVGGGLGIALAMAVVGAFYFVCRRRRHGHSDTSIDNGNHRERPHLANLIPTSIEMDSMTKESHLSLSKTPLISSTSPALSEVELAGSGVAVTKLYEISDNCDSCYKMRDEV